MQKYLLQRIIPPATFPGIKPRKPPDVRYETIAEDGDKMRLLRMLAGRKHPELYRIVEAGVAGEGRRGGA